MQKKHCSSETNNKIFDRTFDYDTSSASFNENILNDRTFDYDTSSTSFNKNILNDITFCKINDNITRENNNNKNINLSDRIFNLSPNTSQIKTDDYFRNINRNNFDTKKIGDKTKNVIVNPNKKTKYFMEPNNILSLKMLTYYQYLLKKSFIASSYSLLSVLSLFYIGTNGESKRELEKCLGISDKNNLYNGLIQINQLLQKSGCVKLVNFIIVNNKIKLLDNYKFLVNKLGFIESVDVKNPNNSVQKVNNIIEKKTNGIITDVLSNRLINQSTEIILINCIYFKSDWKIKFSKDNTQEKEFYDLLNTKFVKMMQLFKVSLPYYENNKYKLLELPYKDDNFTMGILLEKNLNQIIIPPNASTLNSYISKLQYKKVNVQLPKFTQETTLYPADILKMLGIKNIFNHVDAKEMTDEKNIYLNNIVHKAKIIVDESGTESAAVSAILLSNNEQIINFYANHPFIYYIRHVPTNTIIFTGYFN